MNLQFGKTLQLKQCCLLQLQQMPVVQGSSVCYCVQQKLGLELHVDPTQAELDQWADPIV
jgi:hypothetical protein